MREIREKWLSDFVSLGPAIVVDGETIRPETKTSIAIGKVSQIKTVGDNNLRVIVKPAGAKYDFSGFVNENTPVAKLLQQAKEKDVPVCVRFDKKRKKGINPKTPIDELIVDASTARDNIVNVIAGVYNFNNEDWILTNDAISNPDDDPDYVSSELSKATYNITGFFQPEKTHYSNTPIDNNWKANHLISMYNYGSEHNFDNNIELDTNALKLLASYMLKACDQLQMRANNLDTPNYSDYSHTKARSMLFSWMKVNPLSKDIMSTKSGFNNWITSFLEENLAIWEWAKKED